MRKLILLTSATLVLAGAAFGGWHWWTEGRFHETTDNAYVEADIAAVAPKIAGYIRTLAVADNQQVRAGDVLAVIDERDFQAKVAEASAAVAAVEAANVSIDRQIDLQGARIEQAAAMVDSAQAELARAQPEYERYKKMLASKVVAKSDYDRTAADLRKAEAEVANAKAQLLAEQGQLVVLQASRKEGDAKLAQAKAALATAQIDLDNTVIRAPMDGVVGNKGVEAGQYVQAGSLLMAIVPLPSVYIVANFKETQLENMRPGQTVSISVDAFPEHGTDRHHRELRARQRRGVQPAAAGERHRQLHQGGPARARAHRRAQRQCARRPAAAGPLGRGQRRYPWAPTIA